MTLLPGVITPRTLGRGPPCRILCRANGAGYIFPKGESWNLRVSDQLDFLGNSEQVV